MLKTNGMTVVDIESNTHTDYDHSPISAQVKSGHKVFYHDAQFYVLSSKLTGSYLNIIDEAEFLGPMTGQAQFYKNQFYWLNRGAIYLLFISLVILIYWLIQKYYTSRNKIKLLDNGLRYHLKFTEFDQESMAILKLLLSKPHVASNQILKIIEKEQYSPAHNERIKVQKINDINIKISTLLGSSKNIIENFKADNDRRIRVYKIEKKLFR